MIIRYNIQKLEEMISDFYNVTKIQITVLDSELNFITKPVGPPHSFCQRIQACEGGEEKCLQSDKMILEECVKKNQPIVHLCHAGLFDIATETVNPAFWKTVLSICRKISLWVISLWDVVDTQLILAKCPNM